MGIILRNITEDIVIRRLDSMIDKLDCCKCDYCRLDIASYALNRLPTKYVATTTGELLSKISYLETDFDVAVVAAITAAAEVIRKHPRHDAVSMDKLPIVSE